MKELKMLFSPIKVGTMELKNRVVMCPMGTNFANEDSMPTEQMANYYAERAKGGVGLIIAENTCIQKRGRWSRQAAGIWDDKFIPGWRMVVDAVHAYNVKIALEIGHQGSSVSSAIAGEEIIAPSPLPNYLIREVPHEMTRDEIQQVINDEVAAAERAVKAGFDALAATVTEFPVNLPTLLFG